jgi:hypothetical protein
MCFVASDLDTVACSEYNTNGSATHIMNPLT